MNVHEKFQLYVYDGDYSLPSIEVECIKSILYAAVANVPVQLKLLNTIKHLQSKLKPVVEFTYWLDQRNCDEFTNVWFMKALPFPLNYIHSRKLRDRAWNLIETMYPAENNLDMIKEYLNRTATECLQVLSARLGTSDYFFGSSPTSLDVVVYTYVAPLLKLPFPSNELNSIINMWPNMTNFIKRIDSTYFSNLPKQSKYLKEETKTSTNDDDVSYVAILILTVSATSLVLGFAFSRGILASKSLE
ncbi:hypothetical protein NQ317_001567 [Molorchus minor]|uniref:Metaxin-1 n=1 Tax=Molorchus minor TaxID=1323400 RepID=A0ABQ9JJ86_9CUCU|nr:hypothetical protein NQ317_001567 [Molorchus minor]